MAKILGLDVGSKTIGLAWSQGVIATPGMTIRFEEWEFDEALEKLTAILKKEKPDLIVVGYPKNMDGSIGERAEMIDYFIRGILSYNTSYNDQDIIKVDERRTTKMARSILIEAGVRRKQQKQTKDSLAAQLILELYLESNKGRKK